VRALRNARHVSFSAGAREKGKEAGGGGVAGDRRIGASRSADDDESTRAASSAAIISLLIASDSVIGRGYARGSSLPALCLPAKII